MGKRYEQKKKKDMNRYFFKEDIPIAGTHMNRCPTTLVGKCRCEMRSVSHPLE